MIVCLNCNCTHRHLNTLSINVVAVNLYPYTACQHGFFAQWIDLTEKKSIYIIIYNHQQKIHCEKFSIKNFGAKIFLNILFRKIVYINFILKNFL